MTKEKRLKGSKVLVALCLTGSEQNFGAADREGQRAERGAVHELTPFDPVHDCDPPRRGRRHGARAA